VDLEKPNMKSIRFVALFVISASSILFYLLGQAIFDGQIENPQSIRLEKNNILNAKPSECDPLARFPETIKRYCSFILTSAQENNLDPVLIAAVILQESGGDEDAISRSGAIGLMQVMPRDGIASTFMCINGPCFADRPSSQELLESAYNISYGSCLLAGLILETGELREGLKMYGPIHMDYLYADRIISIMEQYQ
jgi:hypothetical protein